MYQLREKNLADSVAIYGRGRERFRPPTYILSNKVSQKIFEFREINPLNAELNLICHLLALLGAHPILHVSKIRVKNKYVYKIP
jgi:hypothetical protein